MKDISLYIHWPFCRSKCPYCDFNAHNVTYKLPEREYVNALCQDLDSDIDSDVDEHGNIKGLIDYDYDEPDKDVDLDNLNIIVGEESEGEFETVSEEDETELEEELVELFDENYHTKNTDFIFNRVFKDE